MNKPRKSAALSTASSLPPARTARDARADGRQEGAELGRTGAPPSNTAPANSNQGNITFKVTVRPPPSFRRSFNS